MTDVVGVINQGSVEFSSALLDGSSGVDSTAQQHSGVEWNKWSGVE